MKINLKLFYRYPKGIVATRNFSVTIDTSWLDFKVFKNWALSNGYNDELVCDGLDPEGNYYSTNCEWVTPSENAQRSVEYHRNIKIKKRGRKKKIDNRK